MVDAKWNPILMVLPEIIVGYLSNGFAHPREARLSERIWVWSPREKKHIRRAQGRQRLQPLLEAGALICQICHSVSLTAGEGKGTGCALPSIPLNLPPLEKLQSPETNSTNKWFDNVQEGKLTQVQEHRYTRPSIWTTLGDACFGGSQTYEI